MHYLTGTPVLSGAIHWNYGSSTHWDKEDGIKISFQLHSFGNQYQRRQAIKSVEAILKENEVPWIIPGNKDWLFDLDLLREELVKFETIPWMNGKVRIEPEFETVEREVFGEPSYEASIAFYITPMEITRVSDILLQAPVEIQESLAKFKKDHPNSQKTAFIMMQFGTTPAHENIVISIQECLKPFGITGLRADSKQYHDDLFPNVLTYLWGCGFGIAIFERIEADDFNPNVSLEVGYMFALKKPVCLLKDRTLKTLHTDLVGKLYRVFDPQDSVASLPSTLAQWMQDKGIG